MNIKEVDKFLTSKLKLEKMNRKKHYDYQIRLNDGKLPLPKLLTLSRSSKEVTKRNIKGLADNLGISLKGFEQGKQCNIRKICIFLCLSLFLLEKAADFFLKNINDPIVYGEIYIKRGKKLCESILLIINDVINTKKESKKWNKDELKELNRAKKRLTDLNCNKDIDTVLNLINDIINNLKD